MVFKIVVSDPKSRKAYQKEVEEAASGLLGKKIGEKVPGKTLGLEGYELEITGGSDREGFPMRPDVEGQGRKRVVLAFPPGFHPVRDGQRKRKSVRGNAVSRDISQINLKVVKAGGKALDALLGAKEKAKEGEKKEGAKPEEKEKAPKEDRKKAPKEEKPAEKPKEEAKPEEKMGVKTLEEKEKEVKKGEPARKEEGPQGGKALESAEGKKPRKEEKK